LYTFHACFVFDLPEFEAAAGRFAAEWIEFGGFGDDPAAAADGMDFANASQASCLTAPATFGQAGAYSIRE
jgi:hypothetical protein